MTATTVTYDFSQQDDDNEQARMSGGLDQDALEAACRAFCAATGLDPERHGICSHRPFWQLYGLEIEAAIVAYLECLGAQAGHEKIMHDAETADWDSGEPSDWELDSDPEGTE